MEVVAISLSPDISLTLIREPVGWRFSQWARSQDDRPLPEPPEHSRAMTFASPGEAVSHFEALCGTDRSARRRIGLECERDSLARIVGDTGNSPTDRWEAAQSRVK